MTPDTYPALPTGTEWPLHMIGDAPIKVMMRETYARIANATAGDRALAAERIQALEWCRANGNPHLETVEGGMS